jgi:hypothetical protein
MLKPIDSCVSNDSASCHFIPSCSISTQSVQAPIRNSTLRPLHEYRINPWFDVGLDGQQPDDQRLTDYLEAYQVWELRDYPVESVLLAHAHFKELKRKQALQIQILQSTAATPGVRANAVATLDTTWTSTFWGQMYVELQNRQDAWGGGRFAQAW